MKYACLVLLGGLILASPNALLAPGIDSCYLQPAWKRQWSNLNRDDKGTFFSTVSSYDRP
jgi:hypothetical protein